MYFISLNIPPCKLGKKVYVPTVIITFIFSTPEHMKSYNSLVCYSHELPFFLSIISFENDTHRAIYSYQMCLVGFSSEQLVMCIFQTEKPGSQPSFPLHVSSPWQRPKIKHAREKNSYIICRKGISHPNFAPLPHPCLPNLLAAILLRCNKHKKLH